MPMSRPRTFRISSSDSSRRSRPLKRMRPPTMRPAGGETRRITDSALTDLPQPGLADQGDRLAGPHVPGHAVDRAHDARPRLRSASGGPGRPGGRRSRGVVPGREHRRRAPVVALRCGHRAAVYHRGSRPRRADPPGDARAAHSARIGLAPAGTRADGIRESSPLTRRDRRVPCADTKENHLGARQRALPRAQGQLPLLRHRQARGRLRRGQSRAPSSSASASAT